MLPIVSNTFCLTCQTANNGGVWFSAPNEPLYIVIFSVPILDEYASHDLNLKITTHLQEVFMNHHFFQ